MCKLLSVSEICAKYMQVGSAVEESSEESLYFPKGMLPEVEAGIAGGLKDQLDSPGWRIIVMAFLEAETSRTQSHSPKSSV